MSDLVQRASRSLHVIASGKVAGDERLRVAVCAMRERGHEVAVSVTWETGDAVRFAADAARRSCETIVAAGGDGTINEVVAGLAEAGLPRDWPSESCPWERPTISPTVADWQAAI